MSESTTPVITGQEGDAKNDLSEDGFFDKLKMNGLALDGRFYLPKGVGRQRRFFSYNAADVDGLELVHDNGAVVGQEVKNHDELQNGAAEMVTKTELVDEVLPKVRDGFGVFGLPEAEADDAARRGDYPPETMDLIRDNYAEHGLFVDEDGQKVVSLISDEGRAVGYITGSHVSAVGVEGVESVDDYRKAVHSALPDVFSDPAKVPIMTSEMMHRFVMAGDQIAADERTRAKLAKQTEQRWEDGAYDHLKGGDSE